jgi:hypothetical protein
MANNLFPINSIKYSRLTALTQIFASQARGTLYEIVPYRNGE